MEAKALITQGSAITAAFMPEIINLLGAPSIVRTDHNSYFQGQFVDVLTAILVDHHLSRPYHPQSNGLVERSVQSIASALERTVGGQGDLIAQSCSAQLPEVVRGYNMSTQSSTRQSPFFLLHGWYPKIPLNTVEIPQIAEINAAIARTLTLTQRKTAMRRVASPAALTRPKAIKSVCKTASENIKTAQKRQAKDYN